MSNDSDEFAIASDNIIVATEVMSSAIRILSLLDLSDREIADHFLVLSPLAPRGVCRVGAASLEFD